MGGLCKDPEHPAKIPKPPSCGMATSGLHCPDLEVRDGIEVFQRHPRAEVWHGFMAGKSGVSGEGHHQFPTGRLGPFILALRRSQRGHATCLLLHRICCIKSFGHSETKCAPPELKKEGRAASLCISFRQVFVFLFVWRVFRLKRTRRSRFIAVVTFSSPRSSTRGPAQNLSASPRPKRVARNF